MTRTARVRYVELPGRESHFLQTSMGELQDEKNRRRVDELLEDIDFNMHSLPVIAANAADALLPFHQKTAFISQGRGFSPEDLSEGRKVLLMPARLGQSSGLKLGSSISLSLTDGLFTHHVGDNSGWIDFYLPAGQGYKTPKETHEYTIIGFYQSPLWDTLPRNLMENTLIVPNSSLTDQYGSAVPISQGFLLANGKGDEFVTAMEAEGYQGLFEVKDQDYGEIAATLQRFRQDAQWLLVLGILLFTGILAMFLWISILRRRRDAGLMLALGAERGSVARVLAMPALWIVGVSALLTLAIVALGYENIINIISGLMDAQRSEINQSGIATFMDSSGRSVQMILVLLEAMAAALSLAWLNHRVAGEKPIMLLRHKGE